MTPTKLIYESWKDTPKPILYQTNDAKGNPLTVICDFMNPKNHKFYTEDAGVCPICGQDVCEGIPSKKFFSANYTDWQYHNAPEGRIVCNPCAFTMLLNSQANRMTLSRYSFCASSKLEILNRGQCRDKLLDPPEPPFVMAVAVSQKKHIAIKSKISYKKSIFYCNFEEESILVKLELVNHYIPSIEALRGIGFTKDEILGHSIRFDKVKDYGMDCIDKVQRIYKTFKDKRLFELCVFVAKKMELEEALCYLDLKRKMKELPEQHFLSMQSTNQETLKEDRVDLKCGHKSNDSQEPHQNEQLTLGLF